MFNEPEISDSKPIITCSVDIRGGGNENVLRVFEGITARYMCGLVFEAGNWRILPNMKRGRFGKVCQSDEIRMVKPCSENARKGSVEM